MGRIAKDQASQVETMDGFEGRYEDIGGYTVGFETYTQDGDPAPLFQGLPDDRCQCPHWGVVVRGKLVYRYGDGSEDVISAGQAYYARPGHVPLFFADSEIIEFSPSDQLTGTLEVVLKNIETSGG